MSKRTEIEFLIKVHFEMHLSCGVISVSILNVHSNAAIVLIRSWAAVLELKILIKTRLQRDQ